MPDIPPLFGGGDGAGFDGYDEFVPEHLPAPDRFLEDHDVLAGDDHVAFHRLTRALFEARTVYDVTFDYNLARLNLDARHEGAGYRYAAERPDADGAVDGVDRVLRAEFTPTTPFCPQTHTLTVGSFRAWNGLAERHEYDLVRVRVAPMHHQSRGINLRLEGLERRYLETGEVPDPTGSGAVDPEPTDPGAAPDGAGDGVRDPPP